MTTDGPRRLILTNDDGIDAPGLAALAEAASALGSCRIVAPRGPHSGGSHVVTTHAPIAIEVRGDGPDAPVAVDGTPADCTRLALHHLEVSTSWLLSGINAGGNLGADIHHSGTVAAAREAALHGLPAVAVSHYIARGRAIDWGRAAGWARRALIEVMGRRHRPGTFWNINLPHPAPGSAEPTLVDCPADPSPLPLDFRFEGGAAVYCGDYQRRARRPGSDIDVCFGGAIAITRVHVLETSIEQPEP